MTLSVFIDGGHGTTGLEIRGRLSDRSEISLIELDDSNRKNDAARVDALHDADIAILCLPDDAAREAVVMAGDSDTRIIDASTAHRIAADWTYGFPEWEAGHRATIAASHRIANPGCHAQAFVALIYPLVKSTILPRDTRISVNATSGYSGGGRAMIEEFEQGKAPTAFRNYALPLAHKHLPEMQQHSSLADHPFSRHRSSISIAACWSRFPCMSASCAAGQRRTIYAHRCTIIMQRVSFSRFMTAR